MHGVQYRGQRLTLGDSPYVPSTFFETESLTGLEL